MDKDNQIEVPNNWVVPAVNYLGTLMVNVDNDKLSDKEFREMVRNTLPIVEKPDFHSIANVEVKPRILKFYIG